MKKILYISHDGAVVGGAALAMLDLIEKLDKKEYKAIVLYPKDAGIKNFLRERSIEAVEFRYFSWCFFEGDSKNAFKKHIVVVIKQILMIMMLPFLYLKLKNIDFDIIHTNSSVINIGMYIKYIFNKPHIWHVREFGEEHLNLKFLFGTSLTRRIMGRSCEKCVCISKAIENKYLKYIGDFNRVITIYDGVTLNSNNFININKEQKTINILITGSIQPGKNQLDAIKAISLLDNKQVRLHVLGSINNFFPEYIQEINLFISDKKLEDQIKFLGHRSDIDDIRSEMDLELICSEYEGFGRVTVEAMMAGLPMVGARSGATPEIIVEGKTGLLYKPGNVKELATKIQYLINNPEIATDMGKNGFERAQKEFTIENHTRKIQELYNLILQK